jgi:hypothetical protein
MAVYGKFYVVIFRKIKTQHNTKNTRDSSHQALTNFGFSEFIFSDFCHNDFLKFLMKNNVAKFRKFIATRTIK